MQQKDGSVKGASSSITNSRGKDLIVETTALAGKLWLDAPGLEKAQKQCEKVAEFLKASLTPRSWMSTQAKVLGLDFLVAYTKKIGKAPTQAKISLFMNGQEVETIVIDPKLKIAVKSYNFTDSLKKRIQSIKAGDDVNLELKMAVDQQPIQQLSLTYTFFVEYYDKTPDLQQNPQLDMKVTRNPLYPTVG